jgi:hypothetical protein
MYRLLQGEVGSGKTVVALRAMLQVVDAGGQAALLAPTEVLAAQHSRSLQQLLGPLGLAGALGAADLATRVTLLTGSQGAGTRRAALAEAADGTRRPSSRKASPSPTSAWSSSTSSTASAWSSATRCAPRATARRTSW